LPRLEVVYADGQYRTARLQEEVFDYAPQEDLRQFWEQPGKKFGTSFLEGSIKRAEASGIKVLQQMAKTLAAHRSGVLAYYDVLITSGPTEGTNNKIKTMKGQAYGFRDREFFKLKILAIHETRYELIG
jgi:transposase